MEWIIKSKINCNKIQEVLHETDGSTINELIERTKLSRNQIMSGLRRLDKKGLIDRHKESRKTKKQYVYSLKFMPVLELLTENFRENAKIRDLE